MKLFKYIFKYPLYLLHSAFEKQCVGCIKNKNQYVLKELELKIASKLEYKLRKLL